MNSIACHSAANLDGPTGPDDGMETALACLWRLGPADTAAEWVRRIVGALEGNGWRVDRRGPGEQPRPMAQLGATEEDTRRVVLYLPFLRFVAERWENEEARLPVTRVLSGTTPWQGRLAALPESERVEWIEALVLLHEFFHVCRQDKALARRLSGLVPVAEGERVGGPCPRREVERAADRLVAEGVEFLWTTMYEESSL